MQLALSSGTARTPQRRAVALTLFLTLATLAGCSSTSTGSASSSQTKSTARDTQVSTTAASGTAFAVGERTETYVDRSRPTSGNEKRKIPAADSRTLPVMVLYPAAGKPAPEGDAAATTVDATPAKGRFPLVVFSHGVTASGPAYKPVLALWARAGFVVVAPTYPMTSGEGAWVDLGDYVNQPADVSFLITEISALDTKSGDPLAGHIDVDEVGIAGHSLGGITTLGFYNSCCRDSRIKAAIEFAGILLPFKDGKWDDPPAIPILMIHGQKDTTVPYAGGSKYAFDALKVPRALITLPTATHMSIFGGKGDEANGTSTAAAAIAFLRMELDHDDSDWKTLGALLDRQGRAWIQVAGGLPDAGPGGTAAKPSN